MAIASQLPALNEVTVASFDPSNVTVLGSRSGPSLADSIVIPVTRVTPMEGETTNPEGLIGSVVFRESKLRYLVGLPSMTLATPSEPGLLDDDAMIGSPGCVTSCWAKAGHAAASASAKRPFFRAWL